MAAIKAFGVLLRTRTVVQLAPVSPMPLPPSLSASLSASTPSRFRGFRSSLAARKAAWVSLVQPPSMSSSSLPSSSFSSSWRTAPSAQYASGRRYFTTRLKRKSNWERPYGDHHVSVSYKGIGEPETGVIVTQHGLGCSRELTLISMKKDYWPGEIEMSRRVAEYFPKWLTTQCFPSWLPILKGRVDDDKGEFSVMLNGTSIEIVTFSQPLFTSENDGWRYQIRGGLLAMKNPEEREGWQEFNCHSFYPDEQKHGLVRVWLHSSLEDFRSRIVGTYDEETNETIFHYRKLLYKYTELMVHEYTMARFHRFIRDAAKNGQFPVVQ